MSYNDQPCSTGSNNELWLSQILASFTNGSLVQLPNSRNKYSSAKEINKRIEHAIDLRSSERMQKEHITPSTLVFKDTHIEKKVWRKWTRTGFCHKCFFSPWAQVI